MLPNSGELRFRAAWGGGDVVHSIKAGRRIRDKSCGREHSRREGGAILHDVSQFDRFSVSGQEDGVIADPAATAHGVHADLGRGPHSDAAVSAGSNRAGAESAL